MQIIGIIAEYNPFHNGHKYHIEKIKELFPDSLIILVLNGYFTERGNISIINKEDKVKIALKEQIDLVIELPTLFGTQSADTFASTSITLLNYLKVDKIIFGSECNDIKYLTNIANELIESDEKITQNFKNGNNYPTNLSKSINYDKILPNDILGISYIKAIIKNKCSIEPITIKRTNDYLDTTSNEEIISATNIRNKILENKNIDNFVPKYVPQYIKNIDYNLMFQLLKYKIISCDNLDIYLDVIEGLEYKLKKVINNVNNIDELIMQTKSKRYTYNRIYRMLIHILLDIKKTDANPNLDYIHILGFNVNGHKYLNKIKKNINIPINVNKDSKIYKTELKTALIYDLLTNDKTYQFEYNNKPIKE